MFCLTRFAKMIFNWVWMNHDISTDNWYFYRYWCIPSPSWIPFVLWHVLVSVLLGCIALNEQTVSVFPFAKSFVPNVFGCHCEWMRALTSALSTWCACPINPILHICLPQRAIVLNCQRKKSAWTEDGEQKVSAKMQNSSFRYSHYLFSFCQKPL